jgi:hypothetical protein
VTGLPTLTLWQPWASLIAAGVKTIETRSWSTKHRGRVGIHAGKSRPVDVMPWILRPDRKVMANVNAGSRSPEISLPLGALVATAELVDVVPITDGELPYPEHWTAHVSLAHRSNTRLHLYEPGSVEPLWSITDITDQLPFGDYSPGRYAWLLDDIEPTTERCPACWGEVGGYEVADGSGGVAMHGGCRTCDLAGHCDPIPAKGKQGLWRWTP